MLLPRLTGRLPCLVACVAMATLAGVAGGQEASQGEFHRGYYLQTHQQDYAGAAVAFEKVAGNADAPAALRAEAAARLAQCREDLASEDLARLMPPDALAYVEISRPGRHVERLLRMSGLVRDPDAGAAESASSGTPLGDGFFFPDDFSISPALLEELGKFRGLALAATSVDPRRGLKSGVLVLHPGNCDLLRGSLETGLQCLTPDEPIEGFKTYQVEGQAWLTLTARLLIVAPTREDVVAAVARLQDPDAKSLASCEGLKRCRADRENALLFAYADGRQMMRQFGSLLSGHEGAMARAALDLDHIESVTVAVGTTEESLQAKLCLNLLPGHKNLVYGLIRTAPLNKRSLKYVPEGIAMAVLLGLNPTGPAEAAPTEAPTSFSAMDIGREVFGNIEEIALFVLPAERPGGSPMPEVAAVMAVKDPAKSEALWNQLLSLAALFGIDGAGPPQDVTIEGQPGKVYSFPDAPPIALVRLKDRALVVGTPSAVAAAVRAGATQRGVAADASFKPLLDRLGPTASKAVLIDSGRMVRTMAYAAPNGRHDAEIGMIASILKDLKISAVSEEGPTQLALSVEVTGLPNAPELLKTVLGTMSRPYHSAGDEEVAETRVSTPTTTAQPE